MTSTGRVARLTALALATGTLVAAGAGTAGASSTQKTNFTASGGGSVLRLTINMPSQLNPVLDAASLPHSLTQDLVLTGGTIRTEDVKALATSTLGANGTVPVLSSLLDKSVTAEYGKPAPAPFTALPQSVKDGLHGLGIDVSALELNSKVANPTVDGELSHSTSEVLGLTVAGPGALTALLDQLNAQIQAVLATALGTATQAQLASLPSLDGTPLAAVTDLVPNLLGTVNTTLQSATNGAAPDVQAAINTVIEQLKALPNLLTQTIKADAADSSLLHVNLIQSEQTVNRAAGVVTSTSSNKLVGLSVLGGLVTVNGLTSMASAELGDKVHKATADKGQNAILDANVADKLHLTLGDDLGISVSGLPDALQGPVQDALDQISTLISGVLGATLTPTSVPAPIETPTHVASSVSAARLVVDPALPLPTGAVKLFDKPLLDVQFVPASADVVRAEGAVPPTVTTPAAAHSKPVFAPTGANFALTAPIAISLMGLAVVARRRRLAHVG